MTVYFVIGAVLVVWALVLSFGGMARVRDFPDKSRGRVLGCLRRSVGRCLHRGGVHDREGASQRGGEGEGRGGTRRGGPAGRAPQAKPQEVAGRASRSPRTSTRSSSRAGGHPRAGHPDLQCREQGRSRTTSQSRKRRQRQDPADRPRQARKARDSAGSRPIQAVLLRSRARATRYEDRDHGSQAMTGDVGA